MIAINRNSLYSLNALIFVKVTGMLYLYFFKGKERKSIQLNSNHTSSLIYNQWTL